MAFIALLATLQALLVLWFVMIIRLAVRVVRGAPAEDDRSEDEDEGVEDVNNVDSDISSLSVANGNIPSNSKSTGTTNGIAFSNGVHQRKTVG